MKKFLIGAEKRGLCTLLMKLEKCTGRMLNQGLLFIDILEEKTTKIEYMVFHRMIWDVQWRNYTVEARGKFIGWGPTSM